MFLSYQANQSLTLLWQATWQSTALAALVVIVILALRQWLPTKWRLVLCTLPLLRMQMADWKSDLKARIEQVARPIRTSRLRSLVSIAIIVALLIVGCTQKKQTDTTAAAVPPTNTAPSIPNVNATDVPSEAKTASAEQRYYITGTVREAVTNQPIAGAKVQLLVSSEQLQEKRVPKGISDANGKYRIEVPMGNVKLWFPSLKPGYWLAPKDAMKDLVTSPEQPEAEHDIIANKSPTWRVHAIGELGEKPILAAMKSLTLRSEPHLSGARKSLGASFPPRQIAMRIPMVVVL